MSASRESETSGAPSPADKNSTDTISQEAPKYELKALCTFDNIASFRLQPSRGKPDYAIVVLTSIDGITLWAESVEILQPGEVDAACHSLRREMTIAQALLNASSGAAADWTPDVSPLKGKACRMLGRSPTAEPVEMAFLSPLKKSRSSD